MAVNTNRWNRLRYTLWAPFYDLLFTDLTRSFHDILARSGAALAIERDEPALLGGLFRHLLLRRRD